MRLTALEEEHRNLSKVEVDEVLRLVRHGRAKVPVVQNYHIDRLVYSPEVSFISSIGPIRCRHGSFKLGGP